MNNDPRSGSLTKRELTWLNEFLLMAGREQLSDDYQPFDRTQIRQIRNNFSKLQQSRADGISAQARCNRLNNLLSSLHLNEVSHGFFNTVFKDTDFSSLKSIRRSVKSFRTLCMLSFGNFRFGYKQLRKHDSKIKQMWSSCFPSSDEATKRGRKYYQRPQPERLIKIEPAKLFALGNFEGGQLEIIANARETLKRIFSEALKKEIDGFARLKRMKSAKGLTKLTTLIAQAGLPRAQDLIDYDPKDKHSFRRILHQLLQSCSHISEDDLTRIRHDGLKNARTYMNMHDLDVYVATSMRAPLHFTTNWTFVNKLFHSEPLSLWNLRYFDPTHTYLHSRHQTGLLEWLMIKRTRLTVYHAQESDTFGKDCEAGVTLAQGKPVVVFVTRLLADQPELRLLYEAVDEATSRDRFFINLEKKGLLTEKQAESLLRNPLQTQGDAIDPIVRRLVPSILRKIGKDRAELELIREGYAPPEDSSKLSDSLIDHITGLERRALRFRAHPLALQASPVDGVARGVIVTRTVAETARVVSRLLEHNMTYDIVDEFEDWVLVDRFTRSPVRVVTKDEELTSAFWSEDWTPIETYW